MSKSRSSNAATNAPEHPKEIMSGRGRGKGNRNFPSHNCTVNHDVDLVKLLLSADSIPHRIARWWRRLCLIDHHSPVTRFVFRSDTAIKREMSRQLTYHPGTIHPLSYFRFAWECLMIVTFVTAFLLIPYDVTFLFQVGDYYPFTAFHMVLLGTDFICLLDVMITFYSGTYQRRTQQVNLDLKRIRKGYLRMWFWIDVISSAPDPLITRLVPPNTLDNSLVYCLHRLDYHPGCLWDLWSLMSVIKIFRFRTLLRYIRNLCERFGLRRNVIKFITILATVLTVFHWSACLMFMVLRLSQGTDPAHVDERSWSQKIPFWNQTSFVRYLECSYRTLYTVTHITHDFNESMTYDDMLMSLIYTISGYILKIYLLAELLIFIRILFSSTSKYHEYRYELSNYMRHEQLPAALQKQVLDFYDFRHPKIYSRWSLIRTVLGEQLYGELRMEILGPLMRSCPLFRATFTDQQLTALALGMKFQLYMKNDIIARWEGVANGPGDESNWNMVFIVTGTVAVYTSSWKEVLHLENGEHFGEFQLLFDAGTVKFPNLVAVENTELYTLSRDWLDRFLRPYPTLRRNLIDLATEQLHQMQQMQRGTVLETLENVETVRLQHRSRETE
ncbi:potassium/sodium hyperpolarization-activated cyclic nucleotide-gated channel 2-like [Anopheles maculipalpis]|uniref:potassium/sodium hyperpolarization-activated cyclic nucleotide-gated channel 2-like n=1 Tax=Anopheles maculipalpis TaxID=1496333 RepID=UPI002158B287|nr:potassium/sodium hyperpolarization-activated cyclic nucleotide-gated channel 2-like [Anopheles maculipalpis]